VAGDAGSSSRDAPRRGPILMRPLCTLILATAPNVAIWALQAGDLLSAAGWLGAGLLAAWMVECVRK
jgi:hypothetical protein